MKKLSLLTVTAVFGLMSLGTGNVWGAPAPTNNLISKLAIVSLFSPAGGPVISTNSNGTVRTARYPAKAVKITTRDMLNLLATEFNTNFPAGAQLAFQFEGEGFVVLDKNGNIFLDVSANAADSSYRFDITNSSDIEVMSGKMVETSNASTTNTVESIAMSVADFAIYYMDGNGNDFHFSGVATLKANAVMDMTTEKLKSVSILLSGSGGGTFFNPVDSDYDEGVFTKASWKASGKNLPGFLF